MLVFKILHAFIYLFIFKKIMIGNLIKNNAFLIPRWGGVVINNPDRSTSTHNFTSDELKSVMSIFIMQLRGLLGVQDLWAEARSGLVSLQREEKKIFIKH